jgi:hypothetical protein
MLGCAAMASSLEDIEGYLQKLERRYERLADGALLVSMGQGQSPVALFVASPVVVLQAGITDVPGAKGDAEAVVNAPLFRKLLELNASDLVHAAYGLENDRIVLTAALDLDHLGLSELEAVLADMEMALAKHVPVLRRMVGKKD